MLFLNFNGKLCICLFIFRAQAYLKKFYCHSVTVFPIFPPLLCPAHPCLPYPVLPHPIVPVRGSFIRVPCLCLPRLSPREPLPVKNCFLTCVFLENSALLFSLLEFIKCCNCTLETWGQKSISPPPGPAAASADEDGDPETEAGPQRVLGAVAVGGEGFVVLLLYQPHEFTLPRI